MLEADASQMNFVCGAIAVCGRARNLSQLNCTQAAGWLVINNDLNNCIGIHFSYMWASIVSTDKKIANMTKIYEHLRAKVIVSSYISSLS